MQIFTILHQSDFAPSDFFSLFAEEHRRSSFRPNGHNPHRNHQPTPTPAANRLTATTPTPSSQPPILNHPLALPTSRRQPAPVPTTSRLPATILTQPTQQPRTPPPPPPPPTTTPLLLLPLPHQLPPHPTAFPPAAHALPPQRPYTPPAGGVSSFFSRRNFVLPPTKNEVGVEKAALPPGKASRRCQAEAVFCFACKM